MSAMLIACSGTDAGVTAPESGADTTTSPTLPTTTDSTTDSTTTDQVTVADDPSTSDTDDATSTTVAVTDDLPLAAPQGDAFYVPPEPIPGTQNGDLIWARPLDQGLIGATAWQVLYRSENVRGEPIAVSGVVVAPTAASDGPRPVLSWAHGTTGLGDDCAPSKSFGTGGYEATLAQAVVFLGFTYVATDYEGLGTPGVHPYLVGQSEGRGVLDIVRAAAQLDGTGITTSSQVAIFGHSQGGHAALMAAELAPTYAPELDVVGAVAGAPPGDLGLIEQRTASAGEFLAGGFGLMMDAGFAATYPDLPADALVTADGVATLDELGDTCLPDAFRIAAGAPDIQLDGTTDPDWAAVFALNSPGHVAPAAPVLIIHGSADVVVPPVLSELVEQQYCDLGVTVQRTVYDGADHGSVLAVGLAEVQGWITDRLAGTPAPTSC
jgi:pimeloyl-ACP methyl ester carboxylesterase